jgi:uncharacterized protein YdhG (YjbR/CyaY superfamily)
MDKAPFRSVDDYLAAQPPSSQRVLAGVRRAIAKAVPGAEESISYNLPTYKLHGRPVVYFAGWKEHISLYPSTARVVAAFARELAPYEVEKGTIRFPLSGTVPLRLIARIAKLRAQEVEAGHPRRPRARGRKR